MTTKAHYFSVDIYYHTFQRHYMGAASSVLVKTDEGVKIQIPASYLRSFVSHMGVKGYFKLVLDEDHQIVSLEQIN